MNAMGNWYFSNKTEEIIVPDVDGKTMTANSWVLSSDISRFWEVKGDGTTLDLVNVSLDMTHPDEDENSPGYMMSGIKNIRTKDQFNKLTVVYSRFPIRHDYGDLSVEIDLPPQLLGVLEFLVFWRLMPVFYEQGSSLANNYLSQAKESLANYAANIGLASQQTRFTA